MARITIDFPSNGLFQTEFQVPQKYINLGDHLGADKVLLIAVNTQLEFLASLGYSDPKNIEGLGVITANAAVDYLAESDLGDVLEIHAAAVNPSDKGVELVYRMYNKSKRCEAASVSTSVVFFDYDEKKTAAMPSIFRQKLNLID